MAISVIGMSLTLFSPYGPEGLVASAFLSIGGGGLALFATTQHRGEILRTLIFSAIGFFLGSMFLPIGAYGNLTAQVVPIAFGILISSAFGSLAYRDHTEPEDAG